MQLVYLSPVPWASFAQRPHKFVEWFHARSGGKVLWIDPYPTRLPELSDLRRLRSGSSSTSRSQDVRVPPSWLRVVSPGALPIEPINGVRIVNRFLWRSVFSEVKSFIDENSCYLAIGKPSELALQILKQYPELPSLYDAMDDFAAFYRGTSSNAMKRTEEKIVRRVGRLLVSSSALVSRFSKNIPAPILVHNACAKEMLPPLAQSITYPTEAVLGYVGTIASWFDWSFISALATANPSSRVRLIGPIYAPPSVHLPNNIELLPACDHAAAMRAMQTFSLGLIPFKINLLTSSVDPVKYYEYRALGLPVISTNFGEMSLRGKQKGVLLLNENAKLANLIEQTTALRPSISEIEVFRSENTWEARFDSANLF